MKTLQWLLMGTSSRLVCPMICRSFASRSSNSCGNEQKYFLLKNRYYLVSDACYYVIVLKCLEEELQKGPVMMLPPITSS